MNNLVDMFINISKRKKLKNVFKDIGLILVIAAVCFALIYLYDQYGAPLYLKYIIGGLIIFIGIITFVSYKVKKKLDLETGSPADDEFTKTVQLHAGNKTFRISMYFWFFLFLVSSGSAGGYEILGIGILGSALIYGICLWYYKAMAGFDEK